MAFIVGLTGGIGSGKTKVASFFKELNVPVYIADVEAKKLMVTSKVLIRQLKNLFGEKAYINNELNRAYIAEKIFNDKALLQEMNGIVHPKVSRHFKKWVHKQNTEYVISESALIFENNNQDKYDFIITVTAPLDLRINRVVARDNSSEEKVKSIINNQLDDVFKIENSNFIIENIELSKTKGQVHKCHNLILEKIRQL